LNHFDLIDGVLRCEGVSLEAIATAVGTPCYVYSTATLERHVTVFAEAFASRRPLIAFAAKANGNIALLATLARAGAGVDTVSAGEIKRALAAGVAREKIIFSGVGKTADELAFAVETGIHQINVESAAELDLLAAIVARLNRRPAIALRVNPDIGAGGHDKISTGRIGSKFGIAAAEIPALYAQAHQHARLDPQGLAVHIGSQIRDLAPLRETFTMMRQLVETLRAQGLPVTRLDLGGGLGVPYFNEPEPPPPLAYAAMIDDVLAGLDIDLAFEPGRMIAANAGVLLTRVIRIQERPGKRILVLDAGLNDLIRPAMYDAFHDLRAVRPAPAPAQLFDIVGPICESGDTFARDRLLAAPAPGDLVAFMSAGAYGAVMASTYNARPLIPEVLVSGDQFAIVRRRWEIEEQMALESLPSWLAGESP
jgi:diaminopimelate decarboxylase